MAVTVARVRPLLLTALVAIFIAVSARPRDACSCVGVQPACQAVLGVKASFVATVVSIEDVPRPAGTLFLGGSRPSPLASAAATVAMRSSSASPTSSMRMRRAGAA